MSDSWNVPKRSNNCSISMLIEKINAIFQLIPIFSSNVHFFMGSDPINLLYIEDAYIIPPYAGIIAQSDYFSESVDYSALTFMALFL